ncbi:hypothetical protein M0R88_13520 [Halorussus gelatinilyticus]|uniref:Uncharacterized protein n=1 Tax=Halorussus gelatinilyticus TaxID=2937524 RepID=A0A8U0IGW0_9EURY|nr:hypothetical protein [Halorussus gelatinilyticus]UPV99533.1 hypothetical protein M0R88_13520 [Halorussus gelatinilyticus]
MSISTGIVAAEAMQVGNENRKVESATNAKYAVSFDEGASTLEVVMRNPTDREIQHGRYVVTVDKKRVYAENLNLSEGERRTKHINITDGINVNRDNHTVVFSTYGAHTQFNFTRKIDSANSGPIPTPYIADVEVTEGTIDGEPSTVANVTLVNPSDQIYSTKLMVHTVGTDGSRYPASVRPGDTRTITVELLDDRGAKIAGEARLYTDNLTDPSSGIDQVEFAGQVGTETRVWNASYEPVRPTWMQNNYEYHNDSYAPGPATKLSGGHELAGVPVVYLLVGVLFGLFAFRKLR